MTTLDAADDPDGFDATSMALIAEAATLMRDLAIPRPEAVEKAVQRVRVEAFLTGLAGTVFGSINRVAKATPDLLGLVDPPVGDGLAPHAPSAHGDQSTPDDPASDDSNLA